MGTSVPHRSSPQRDQVDIRFQPLRVESSVTLICWPVTKRADSLRLLRRLAFVFANVANVRPAIATVFAQVTPVGPKVARVAGYVSAVLAQLLLGRAFFPVVAQVTNISPAVLSVLANVPAVAVNIARVGPDVSPVATLVFALRPGRSRNST